MGEVSMDHGFQNPLATTPGAVALQPLSTEPLEGNMTYRWFDSPQPCVAAAPSPQMLRSEELLARPMAVALPPPPAAPAPFIEEPSAPGAPLADPEASQLRLEGRQTSGLSCTADLSGRTLVQWAVDAKKLDSQDKQAVSPQFLVDLPGFGPQPFKMTIYPKVINDGKRGASFKKAKGRGRVVLKCEAQLPQGVPDVAFRIGIGRGEKVQPYRGPLTHNFSERSMCGLAKSHEEWDLGAAVDETGTFLVSLELAPCIKLPTNPGLCWGINGPLIYPLVHTEFRA